MHLSIAAALLLPLALAAHPALAQPPTAPAASERRAISTPSAPAVSGPVAQAVRVGGMLFVSGQIAIDPATNLLRRGTIDEETRLVLENVKAVVEAAGMTMADIVFTTVAMKDLNEFARMNAVYALYFPSAPPARSTIEVGRLPRDVKLEISAIAVR